MKTRILLVDDEKSVVAAMSLLLTEDGYDVVALESSAEAAARLEAEPFDALITDLEMPGMHGFELIQRARKVASPPSVLVVTAYGEAHGAKALAYGARRVFAKPLDLIALEEELAEVAAALAR